LPNINKAILIGHLGKDPEVRFTPSGQVVASFSMATTRKWKDKDGQKQEQTDWHNIVIWGKQAEIAKEWLHKGDTLYIEGRIQNRSYDDKEGNKRYISEIVVFDMQFIKIKGKGSGDGPSEQPPDIASDDDDLPF